MNYSVSEYKNISKEEEFSDLLGTIVSIVIAGYGKTVVGRLVSLSDSFLTLEHKDGRQSKVRRRDISYIAPIPRVEEVV